MTKTQLELKDVAVNVVAGHEVKNLLEHINLTLNQGDFATVIGTNGAGKSTMFNAIAGDLEITHGTIELAGERVDRESPEKRARLIARVFQDPRWVPPPG